MAETPNQRRYPRVDADHVVLVKRIGPQPLEGFTWTRVMGRGGCLLVSDEPLGVNARLEVLLSFEGRVVQTQGRVAYENAKGDDQYEVGVEFLEIAAEDQEFLCRHLPGTC